MTVTRQIVNTRYDVTGWPSSNLCPNSRGLEPERTSNWVIKYLVVAANLSWVLRVPLSLKII